MLNPCGHRVLSFHRPPAHAAVAALVGPWALSTGMLRAVGLAELCCLFGCVLRERSCVLVCEELSVLSRAALLLLCCLDPLKWEGISLPVTPPNLMMMMDAPVSSVL